MTRFILSCIAACVLFQAGCASRSPQPVVGVIVPVKHQGAIRVVGAHSPATEAFVSYREYAKAVESSICQNQVMSSVSSDAPVTLAVQLQDFTIPTFGFSMSATAVAKWTVTLADGTKVEQKVAGAGEKGFTDAFSGENRSRLASRAAIEDTIRQGLIWLSGLPLSTKPAQQ